MTHIEADMDVTWITSGSSDRYGHASRGHLMGRAVICYTHKVCCSGHISRFYTYVWVCDVNGFREVVDRLERIAVLSHWCLLSLPWAYRVSLFSCTWFKIWYVVFGICQRRGRSTVLTSDTTTMSLRSDVTTYSRCSVTLQTIGDIGCI